MKKNVWDADFVQMHAMKVLSPSWMERQSFLEMITVTGLETAFLYVRQMPSHLRKEKPLNIIERSLQREWLQRKLLKLLLTEKGADAQDLRRRPYQDQLFFQGQRVRLQLQFPLLQPCLLQSLS